MKLLYQTHSPYARKVLVLAHETGLADGIEVVHHETSPTLRNEAVYAENPLGQVPVLVRPGLPPLFDSYVICDWLDAQHGGRRWIPVEPEARAHVLRIHAVAQGMGESGGMLRWETVRRPERLRYPPLVEGHTLKLVAAYDWLEGGLDFDAEPHLGHVAVATMLAWLEFRALPSFRDGRARLARWYDGFARRASMRATPMSGETVDA